MWTLQDAKNRFSAVVEAAIAGTPQHVTRRGRPAVVVISEAEFARLTQGNRKPSFIEHLLAIPQADSDEDFVFERPREPLREVDL